MSEPQGWLYTESSTQMSWTCERYPRGCRWCRLRALIRWPRPYRHFNCGPS